MKLVNCQCLVDVNLVLHRLQPSRNVLDSQGFDSYVKDQGLPKWSPIVCQGSGHGHDVYCGQPARYDSNNGYSN